MVPDLIQSQSCGDALIYLSRHLIDGGSGGPNNCLDCAVAGGAGDSHPVPFSSQAAGPAPRQGHPPKVRDSLPAHPVSPSIRLRDAGLPASEHGQVHQLGSSLALRADPALSFSPRHPLCPNTFCSPSSPSPAPPHAPHRHHDGTGGHLPPPPGCSQLLCHEER